MEIKDMSKSELEKRLFSIGEMLDNFFNSKTPILNTTYSFLERIQQIAFGIEEDVTLYNINPIFNNCITISCDALLPQDPEGSSSISYVIDFNDPKQININSARFSKSKTINQAKYDSIYFSLVTLIDLASGINISKPINIISDNLLVIQQLNGEKKCKDKELKHKRDVILELVELSQTKGISIVFSWKPKNSTPRLLEASDMAQNLLGVKNR